MMPTAMDAPKLPPEELALRRRRAVRTAAIAGAIAFAVYVAFILSGVLAQ